MLRLIGISVIALSVMTSSEIIHSGAVQAAPKAPPAGAKAGWNASEVQAVTPDPAYAAYDSGNYDLARKLALEAVTRGERTSEHPSWPDLRRRQRCSPGSGKGCGVVHEREPSLVICTPSSASE